MVKTDGEESPIYLAALKGHAKVIEILAPLTDMPNAPDSEGYTPINEAAHNGHKNVLEALIPFTDTPNVPSNDGITPIHRAAGKGHTKFIYSKCSRFF